MVPTDLRLRRSIAVASGVVALVAGGAAMVWPSSGRLPPAVVTPVADERTAAGPLDGRTAAWLTVGDAAARVRVRFAQLPGLLYRISTAADAGVVPIVSRRGGRVTLRLDEAPGDGLDEVRIVLNRTVRWDIRLPAGAGEQQLNLRDGRVRRVEIGTAGLAEVWLPEPDGTVPVVFTGGIGTAVVSVRRGTRVRIHLTQGAGSVDTPWLVTNGTAAGTVLREPAFRRVADRYAIRADGGIGTLVLRRPTVHGPRAVPGPLAQGPDTAAGPPASGLERPGPVRTRPKAPVRSPGSGSTPDGRGPDPGRISGTGSRPGSGEPGRTPGRGSPPGPGQPGRSLDPARMTATGAPAPGIPPRDGIPGDRRISPAAGRRSGVAPTGPS